MNEVTTGSGAQVPSTNVRAADQVLKSDILVPYVVIAQAMSESVQERKAQLGDIVRSTTLEKLGDPTQGLEVIFLHNPKTNWIYEQKEGSRFKYRYTRPRNASNELAEWSYWGDKDGNEMPQGQAGGSDWRRVKQFMVFAILPRDIAAFNEEMKRVEAGELPDPNKALTPVILSFRSSSYKAGKEVATFFTQAKSMKTPISRYKLPISCKLESNDEGSFYVWVVDRSKAKAVAKEDMEVVNEWVAIVDTKADSLAVHEEGVGESYADAGVERQANPTTEAQRNEVC